MLNVEWGQSSVESHLDMPDARMSCRAALIPVNVLHWARCASLAPAARAIPTICAKTASYVARAMSAWSVQPQLTVKARCAHHRALAASAQPIPVRVWLFMMAVRPSCPSQSGVLGCRLRDRLHLQF